VTTSKPLAPSLGRIILWVASAGVAWLAPTWRPTSLLSILAWPLLGAAHAALAFAAITFDGRSDPARAAWVYRGGFLVSLGLGLARAATIALSWSTLLRDAVVLIGAFAGALEATRRDLSLWEDNYPPGEEVAGRVEELHTARLGRLPPTPWAKRAFDLVLAAFGAIPALPVALITALAVWLEDPGPLLFVKNSVGRGGRSFRQWKARTMVRSAEAETGPVLAAESDERVLWTGRWLRKTALDELPQLVNILQGTMSFVGPRPQRTVLVDTYLARLPEYADRHRVSPGLAGLAQVAGDYYLTPHQKLRYDRLYVRHAGIAFDLRLIVLAFATVFWLRWRPGWNGRLPRSWLHRPRRRRPAD
jgi:lipopolysaccharide/colanic/teichoic acid biosynthesis glycosyltransferase